VTISGAGLGVCSEAKAFALRQHAVHAHWAYDVDVDTSAEAPEECAAAIREQLEKGRPPQAFTQLATH
jgi:chloramphenicol 3-O-phosphotransferase